MIILYALSEHFFQFNHIAITSFGIQVVQVILPPPHFIVINPRRLYFADRKLEAL